MSQIKKYIKSITFLLLFSVVCTKAYSQEKRQQLFDYDWKFYLGDEPKAGTPDFDDSKWRKLDLPHDWSIEGKAEANNPTGNDGGYFPAGVGWYRKTFDVPSSWRDKQAGIYFEGVYMNAEVFINGKSLGVYPYGYSSFNYDLTPYLNYGKKNVIAVRVDNSMQKNCRWYSGSGIYRHVWLTVTDNVHIAPWGISITTPQASGKEAMVKVATVVKNATSTPQSVIITTNINDTNKKKGGYTQSMLTLAPNSEQEVVQAISIQNPRLWSPDAPYLYKAFVRVVKVKDNETVDEVVQAFGVRSISFDAKQGFQLNGKTVKLNGGCVHHDNGCLGAAAYDRAEERKVELLKAAGFNAVRTSHNPPSVTFLDACDRLGLLVIDESFDGWRTQKNKYDYAMIFDAWWQRDVAAMVKRDRNHPSIIMWSIGNEIIERKEPQAVETAKMLAAFIRNIDASRPVTSTMTTWDKDWDIFDPLMAAHDVCGYNYQLHRAVDDHKRVPERVILQTESYPRDAFANWQLVQEHDYIIGDFVWTAMDYLGESGIGRYFYPGEPKGEHYELNLFPWHGAYCGDVDLTGWRKPISHYRSMLYNDTEKLYMAVKEPSPAAGEIKETLWSVWPTWERWTWPGYESKNIEVEVYSKYSSARLYLNNTIVGEMATSKSNGYKAVFSVPYAPGVLKAAGIENGKEKEVVTLSTAGAAAAISLAPDKKVLKADGQDLSYIIIELKDKNGVAVANAENLLSFSISGNGAIAGVDNANLKDPDAYNVLTRKAWNGRALVVVKSGKDAGDITLTVTSAGLPDAKVVIKSSK